MEQVLPPWRRHVISVAQFTRQDLEQVIFPEAERMRMLTQTVGKVGYLSGKVLTTLFYEPSTRTAASFVVAIERLGGSTAAFNEVSYSSVAKGESLPDTVRTIAAYVDAVVLRHPQAGAAAQAAAVSPKPIINAGDGVGEHPTQALLDLFTIKEELNQVDGLTVALLGDLKNGRTVHSLARLLTLFDGVRMVFVSPPELRMPEGIMIELERRGARPSVHDRLDEVVPDADVIYVTRIQRERFASPAEAEAVQGSYAITPATLTQAKLPGRMIVMHPLPRLTELSTDVDADPRAAYFRQVENGMYVRMALLKLMLRPA